MSALVTTPLALGSSPPVGHLPPGPKQAIRVKAHSSFKVLLPRSKRPGLVWRLDRPYAKAVARQIGEGEEENIIWVRFSSGRPGTTPLIYALTRGETVHAYASRTYIITVHN
jgi:hypothetical protein